MLNIDLKDKKILYIVSQDASLPYSEMAKLTKLSRDIIINRIRKLESLGIIKGYKANINYRMLGFNEYDIYIKLIGADEARQKDIIRAFEQSKYVTWIGTCFGNYDLRISMQALNNEHLQSNLIKITQKFSDNIKEQEVVSLTKKYKLNAHFFILEIFPELKDFKLPEKLLYRIDISGKVDLDNEDRKILKIIGNNPLQSYIQIAKSVSMTPEGVKYKLKRLKEKGVLKNISAIIDGNKLGMTWFTFVFKLNLNPESEKLIEQHILSMNNATAAVRLMGKWDLGITIYAKTIKDSQKTMLNFKNKFKDIIKDDDSLVILDIYKYPKIAEGTLE